MKGGAFDLLTGRRGGIEVDEIGLSCLFIQVLSHTHNIHSGTYLTAGDVTIVDGENGVVGDAHIMYQRFAAGAEHLGDTLGCPVQKFKGFLIGHPNPLFPSCSLCLLRTEMDECKICDTYFVIVS